ncbi:MAG: hypothetical protein H6Q64_1958 [Firmicutes bacterium]|nr:hypothetical protein [Bacillota bacterium]
MTFILCGQQPTHQRIGLKRLAAWFENIMGGNFIRNQHKNVLIFFLLDW